MISLYHSLTIAQQPKFLKLNCRLPEGCGRSQGRPTMKGGHGLVASSYLIGVHEMHVYYTPASVGRFLSYYSICHTSHKNYLTRTSPRHSRGGSLQGIQSSRRLHDNGWTLAARQRHFNSEDGIARQGACPLSDGRGCSSSGPSPNSDRVDHYTGAHCDV